ncbi:MAG: hypothetical protein H0W88_12485 [Parachlamydiaceae bacterium]|nr:hypothetical protein [Parachlamydiaceae bacterium]
MESQYNILKLALGNGSFEVVKYLIGNLGLGKETFDKYYDWEATREEEEQLSLLSFAVQSGNEVLLKYLIKKLKYPLIEAEVLFSALNSRNIIIFNYLCTQIDTQKSQTLLTHKN